jgi:hypothetical protein
VTLAPVVEAPEELLPSREELVHLVEGRAVPPVAACTLKFERKMTEDPGEVTCPKCNEIQLSRLGLAYGA